MDFHVTRPEVLNNLIRFRDRLSEMREKRQQGEQEGEDEDETKRKYKVLLNRKTGDMRFARNISYLEEHIAKKGASHESLKDFTEVQIIVTEKRRGPIRFDVVDAHEQVLGSNIDPLAKRVAAETIRFLNQKIDKVQGMSASILPEEAVLKELANVRVIQDASVMANLPGWVGAVGRLDAEQLLESQSVGTYILREGDEITISISFHLTEANQLSVHPYVLTVVEEEDKISDFLLLQTEKGWCHYNDDPNLNDPALYPFYPTVQALLESLKSVAKHPRKGG